MLLHNLMLSYQFYLFSQILINYPAIFPIILLLILLLPFLPRSVMGFYLLYPVIVQHYLQVLYLLLLIFLFLRYHLYFLLILLPFVTQTFLHYFCTLIYFYCFLLSSQIGRAS